MSAAKIVAKKHIDGAVKKGIDKLGEKVVTGVGKLLPGVGVAVILTSLVKDLVEASAEAACEAAKHKLECEHIKVCPAQVGAGLTTRLYTYAASEEAMAFVYLGMGLCHAQAEFDVKEVSTATWRWNGTTVSNTLGNMRVEPCRICSRKSAKWKHKS